MKNRKDPSCVVWPRRVKFSLLCVLLFLLCAGCQRSLGVYSLSQYENGWKDTVTLPAAYDPYYDFYTAMTAGTDAPYADPVDSRRYKDSEVTIRSVLPIPGDDLKSWDEFDLVFFYGHNNTIVPPHPADWFHYSTYNSSTNTWTGHWGILSDIGWGDTTPYDYYALRPIDYADVYSGAVTYLYNEYTSSLLGGMYDYGGGGHFWREHWYDPAELMIYDQLGDIRLNWLILHGCQAVITANEDGSYNPLGLSWFHWVQGKVHMVLGHWISYSTSYITSSGDPLTNFASDLLSGVTVQTAYFDTAPYHNVSAIAAEANDATWVTSTMANDKWIDAMEDNEDASVFSQRWVVTSWGTTLEQWD